MGFWHRWRWSTQVLLTVVVILGASFLFDVGDVFQTIRMLSWGAFLLAFLLSAIPLVAEGARLHILLPRKSLSGHLRIQLRSMLWALITPAQLGGEASRVVALRRDYEAQHVLSALLLARVLSLLLCLLAIAVLLPYYAATSVALNWQSRTWIFVLASLSVFVVVCVLSSRVRDATRAFLSRMMIFIRSVPNSGRLKVIMLSALQLITRAAVLVPLVGTTSMMPAEVWLVSVLAIGMATVASIFPLTISGLGIREGVIAAVLYSNGIGLESAVAAAIVSRLTIFAWATIGQAIPADLDERRTSDRLSKDS